MSTVTPPAPPQTPPATPLPVPVVTVTQPPVELARLTIGGLLEASVVSQVSKDAYLLQTPIGQLSVQTTVALPKEATLLLQILSLSPQAQLQINIIDGIPATAALRTGLSTGQMPGLEKPAAVATGLQALNTDLTAPPLLAGTVVKAVLVRPLTLPGTGFLSTPSQGLVFAPPTVAGKSGAPAPAGTVLSGTPTPTGPAATGGLKAPTFATGLPGASQNGTKGLSSPTPRQGAALQGASQTTVPGTGANPVRSTGVIFPVGTQVSFKVINVQLPSPVANKVASLSTASGPGALGVGKMLSGSITGTTASGHPVVQTEAGVFSLKAQASNPRGSIVTLEVATPPKVTAAATAPQFAKDTDSIFADRRWPPLEEAVKVLHEITPAASRHLVNSVLPRPDVQLTAGLIFFLSALRGGDLRQWFGESNMRILEKAQPNLASRISGDFNILAKVADEPGSNDWRVAMIPINTGFQIEQVRMLVRHHENEHADDGAQDQGTRFILDVDLSLLGRIQLDGLVRDKGQKLDLIIRSGDIFNDESRNEIRRIFVESADLTGLQGSVSFQASPPDFIDIPDPLADEVVGLVV